MNDTDTRGLGVEKGGTTWSLIQVGDRPWKRVLYGPLSL